MRSISRVQSARQEGAAQWLSQSHQDAVHLLDRNRNTENLLDALRSKGHRWRGFEEAITSGFHASGQNLTVSLSTEQMEEAPRSNICTIDIDTALESVRRVTAESKPSRSLTNRDGIEPGTFEQDSTCSSTDHRLCPPHDTG